MKKVDYLIVRSTDSGEGIPVTKKDIIELHTSDQRIGGFGFNRPGIDYLVQPDGGLDTLISEDNPTMVDLWDLSKGKDGIVKIYKIISYVGGRTEKEVKPKNTTTAAQMESLEHIVKFYILKFPTIQVLGYDEIPSKEHEENPAFSISIWLEEIGVNERNIYKKNKKEEE